MSIDLFAVGANANSYLPPTPARSLPARLPEVLDVSNLFSRNVACLSHSRLEIGMMFFLGQQARVLGSD